MRCNVQKRNRGDRRGAIAVLGVMFIATMLGMVAFAVDLGYISLTKSQLQNAADSAAIAGASHLADGETYARYNAQRFAGMHRVAGANLANESLVVEFGTWSTASRTFTATPDPGNAVRITAVRDMTHGGQIPLFFAPIFGKRNFVCQASAVAVTNPRDIVFVVDLSGSMNNDTEPAWATNEINAAFGADYPAIADQLMQQVYDDFGYGTFPGTLNHVGAPLGVAADQYAYAEMTKNSGPLTQAAIAAAYRISNTNTEATRKQKAYKWMIDNQIATTMPGVKPTPNSADAASYAYWEKYLDYVMRSQVISSTSPKGKPRPSYSVTLPPNQWGNRIDGMANPYADSFPDASSTVPQGYRNKIGYRSYVQFMMDMGREGQPVAGQYTPLSKYHANCPWHDEETDGGTFSFPPREQPTHAARRAIIAAIQVIKQRNEGITDPNQCDQVAVVTFDTAAGVNVACALTTDYTAAMQACAGMQAVSDMALSTATENGLIAGKNHIASPDEGGQGRYYTNKVVVLLTDGIPNIYQSSSGTISSFIGANPSDDFYASNNSRNAALMQCMSMQMDKWMAFPVGIGLGTNYDFMDRCARLGGTANTDGECMRGSGNPAEYENRLREIFEQIITNPKVHLVQ